jgi:prepilin-type processing-associated H-X9-DG protein
MTSSQTTPSAPAQPKISGLAIASLVCGIGGLCTAGLASIAGVILGIICGIGGLCTAGPASIAGVILGIIALKKIGRSGGQVAGRGLAIGGIVASIITLLLGAILVAASFFLWRGASRAWETASVTSQRMIMQSHTSLLCHATMAYAAANEDRFPPPDAWPQALKDAKVLSDDSKLTDPRDPAAGRAIAMNALLAGKKSSDIRQRSETVLFFECAPGAPPAGGAANLPPEPRDRAGYVIGFCDGHVETVAKNNLGRLIWDPERQ